MSEREDAYVINVRVNTRYVALGCLVCCFLIPILCLVGWLWYRYALGEAVRGTGARVEHTHLSDAFGAKPSSLLGAVFWANAATPLAPTKEIFTDELDSAAGSAPTLIGRFVWSANTPLGHPRGNTVVFGPERQRRERFWIWKTRGCLDAKKAEALPQFLSCRAKQPEAGPRPSLLPLESFTA